MKFKKVRDVEETMNDLWRYIEGLGREPAELVNREVRRWGEFGYEELERAIASGRLEELLEWQGKYAEFVNTVMAPLWLGALKAGSESATRGKLILSDTNDLVRKWIEKHGAELVTQLSNENKLAIRNVLTKWTGEELNPSIMARQIRPLIGLTNRQTQAAERYREKVYNRLTESGMDRGKAWERSAEAAGRYASKMHRTRAENIVNTELAFAYNQGAHQGVRQAVGAGLMRRCAMIWTTAGVMRTCARCLEKNGKIIGYTDESGVEIPPAHTRCRCAIMYEEVGGVPAGDDIKARHRELTLQSEKLANEWSVLQSEIERLAPRGNSPRLEALYTEQEATGDKLWEAEKNLRKIRLTAARKGVILTTDLSKELGAEEIKAIVEQVRNAPENLRILWNMAEAEMKIIDKGFRGTSHYDLKRRGILFDSYEDRVGKRQYKILLHEVGHLLDHFMGNQMYLNSYTHEGGKFAKSLKDEAQAAVKAEMARLKAQALEAGVSPGNIKMSDAQRALSKKLEGIEHEWRAEVSDIFSGATKNKVTGGYMHKNSYWREPETLPTEAFAHMFCATVQSPESLEQIRRWFPKSYEIFMEMIDKTAEEMKAKWLGKNWIAYLRNTGSALKRDFLRNRCRLQTGGGREK